MLTALSLIMSNAVANLPMESGSMNLLTRISKSSMILEHLDLGLDNKVSFSLCWNFASLSGLKYCCDYIVNFRLRAERIFPRENLLRCKNKIDAHARAPF